MIHRNWTCLSFLFLCIACHGLTAQVAPSSCVVLELFTSQSSSSCPPADSVLNEIARDARLKKKPVYTLAFHVDYWNKLGWKDPFSKFSFTKRQNNYVSAIGGDEVYTPQLFVNGKYSLNGAERDSIKAAIEKEARMPAVESLFIKRDSILRDTLFLSFMFSKPDVNHSLVVCITESGLRTQITSGENKGKTLYHENVVRQFEIFPLNEAKGSVKIPVHGLTFSNKNACIGYAQQKQTKRILAAVSFSF